MTELNSSNFLHQGRRDAIFNSIPTVDPVLNKAMLSMEELLEKEEVRHQEQEGLIENGLALPHDGYEFDEEEFIDCIPRVLELLKNKGNIPESITDMFERAKYADDWYVFCNALVTTVITCDVTDEERTDPAKSMGALSKIMIDEDFVQKYLRPHSIVILRYDAHSPYKDINQDLSLPVIVLTQGIITHRMPVSTSLNDVWWYNILSSAHDRWEMILGQAMDLVEGSGIDPEEIT